MIETGGQAYFDALARRRAGHPQCQGLCAHILADSGARRAPQLIRIGEDIVNTAYDAPTEKTPGTQIAEAEKALYARGRKQPSMAKATMNLP